MNLSSCLLVGAGLLLTFGSPQEAQKRAAPDASTQKAGAPTAGITAQQVTANDTEYKIGAQDLLRIDVWKEDQLTRTVPVRPDGKVTVPLLNDVQAAGVTPMELASVISEQLKKYINNPQVTVSVTEINSRRVYVTGEVSKAGAYALLPNMTVLQALSSSGGFTQFARVKNIYVLRTENGKQVKMLFDYKDAGRGKKPERNIAQEA